MRTRVEESSNSRSPLAGNSHALSSTLMRSHWIWTCSNFSWESLRVFSRLVHASWSSMRVEENSHVSQLSTTLILVWPGLYTFAIVVNKNNNNKVKPVSNGATCKYMFSATKQNCHWFGHVPVLKITQIWYYFASVTFCDMIVFECVFILFWKWSKHS